MKTFSATNHQSLTTLAEVFCSLFLTIVFSTLGYAGEADEVVTLFNGKNLDGWEGDPKVWSVRDGSIVGSSVDHAIKANTFLVWKKGIYDEFYLTYKARLEGDNNSGVQYRSELADPKTWKVIGYQADMHAKPEYTAMLYGEGTGRSIIAQRGTKATLETDATKSTIDKHAFDVTPVDISEWHEYEIIANGNRLIHKLDGKTTIDVTDKHKKALKRGVIALQVHAGKPMTVHFKDIELTTLYDLKLETLSDKPRE